MSPERKGQEPAEDGQYEVRVSVSFKPFEKHRKFFYPKKHEQPYIIPEDYDYVLALRKKVAYLGIEGYIDVISEDPKEMFASLVRRGAQAVEKPLGEVAFIMIYDQKGTSYREVPYILRFSFLVKNPSDYAKLLNSYVDINCMEKEYMLLWNVCRPCTRNNVEKLRDGKKLLIIEKNLFSTKLMDDEMVDGEEFVEKVDDEHVGRVTWVWLPKDLKLLRKIELVFNVFGGDHYVEQPTEPNQPEQMSIPVLV